MGSSPGNDNTEIVTPRFAADRHRGGAHIVADPDSAHPARLAKRDNSF
jgi:hypothetical protein